MNILIITKNYFPSTIPDSKRFTGISEFLAKKGHNVTIITETDNAYSDLGNISIIKTTKKGEDSLGMGQRLYNHLSFMVQTMSKGNKLKNIDAIISTSPPLFNLISGAYLKWKLKAKYIVDLRDIWPEVFEQTDVMTKNNIIYRVFNYIAKIGYKKADAIAVVTKGKHNLLSNKFPKYKNKLEYLSNGFNMNITEYEELPELRERFDGFFNIVYTGKVGIAQNLEVFIDLANIYKENPKIRFHIMGSGNGVEKLQSYIKSLNLTNVIFYGYRNEQEVITALRNSQIAYVSLGNRKLIDSVPTKIYEAMVSGCPILISAVGESVELVLDNQFGLASDPDDFESLKSNLEYMIENYESYKAQSSNVREEMIKKYSRNVIAADYEDLLLKISELK